MGLGQSEVVDNWTVRGPIGSGGMADVYLVEHNDLGSMHALKLMSGAGAVVRQRLIAEGQMQAKVKHPNLVLVTDMLEVHGELGLVMQYIDGPTLGKWLREDHALPQLMTIFLGIVNGMGFAHKQGFIHRDLKPGNVLLEMTGDGWKPRIIDFGLVKAVDVDGKGVGTDQTSPGAMMGTPEFMAPEQVTDASTVDVRADMWALGALLYRIVCGVNAFPQEGIMNILNAVVGAKYIDPREHDPSLPDIIVDAINGLLVIRREERIPDCETLLKVLGVVPDPHNDAAPWRGNTESGNDETWPAMAPRLSLPPKDRAAAPVSTEPAAPIPLPVAIGVGVFLALGSLLWLWQGV